jgi:hypothetical protein
MSVATKVGIALGAAAFSGMAVAGNGGSTNDMQSRIEAAEAKIAELSAQQNTDWMSEARSEQVRGIVQDVLADADTRASLQGDGATSGYNDGFFVKSADGKWSMKINGLFQERWNLGHQGATTPNSNPNVSGNYNTAFGFETTRAVLNFSGELAGKAYYNARLDWSPYNVAGGNGISNDPLEWAYGGWHQNENWDVQVGRQKFGVMRSFMVNAEDQQAIERSSYSYYWDTSSITNGIKAVYSSDQMRGNAMFSNGSAGANRTGNNAWTNNQHGWAVTGRGEFLLKGTWDQFDEIGSTVGGAEGWLLGLGGGYLRNQNQSENNWIFSGDLSYQANGWNAYGSATVGDNNNGVASTVPAPTIFNNVDNDNTSVGFEVGAGVYLNDNNELYGRWQWLSPGGSYGGNYAAAGAPMSYNPSSKLNIATIGLNHYIAGPNAKLSVDWNWCFSDPSTVNTLGAGAFGPTGWWNNIGGNNGMTTGSMWLLRTQLQISF